MTMEMRNLIRRMRRWASDTRSLAAYQEKLGNHDARAAMISAALTVEGWADEMEKALRSDE